MPKDVQGPNKLASFSGKRLEVHTPRLPGQLAESGQQVRVPAAGKGVRIEVFENGLGCPANLGILFRAVVVPGVWSFG